MEVRKVEVQGVSNSNLYPVNTKKQAEAPEWTPVNNTGLENVTKKTGKASEHMIKAAVSEANNNLRISNRRCQFTYEKDINRVSVKLIDEDTGEVIREIPSEETLDMLRRLKEMTGLLVDEQR